jgi:hypothetical protein
MNNKLTKNNIAVAIITFVLLVIMIAVYASLSQSYAKVPFAHTEFFWFFQFIPCGFAPIYFAAGLFLISLLSVFVSIEVTAKVQKVFLYVGLILIVPSLFFIVLNLLIINDISIREIVPLSTIGYSILFKGFSMISAILLYLSRPAFRQNSDPAYSSEEVHR